MRYSDLTQWLETHNRPREAELVRWLEKQQKFHLARLTALDCCDTDSFEYISNEAKAVAFGEVLEFINNGGKP